MLYAITINKKHLLYDEYLNIVANSIEAITKSDYIELVNHSNDHIHGLINTPLTLQELIDMKVFHVERIRNTKAYQRYMISHDMVAQYKVGELPYHENDSIVDDLINLGPIKTVQKYGMQALRIYKTMKEFYEDFTYDGNKEN